MQLIISSTEIKPSFICGKPSKSMLPESLKNQIIMFGDSLKTDKVFSECCNIDFIYVNENDKDADMSHLGVFYDILNFNSNTI